MRQVIKVYFIVVLFVIYISCKKDIEITKERTEDEILAQYFNKDFANFNYANQALPSFFNNQFVTIQNNTPSTNPTTNWGALLGRVLFYDKFLSINNTIACASCHKQEFGFTDTAQFSAGFNGGFTKRHSMSLINAKYYINGRFFWDERAATLEDQVLQPIQDAVEMGMDLKNLELKLRKTMYYPILFKRAFGDTVISSVRISKALAQFVRSIISYQSKYDEGRNQVANREVDFPNYTAEENIGKNIFLQNNKVNCFGCHNTDVFVLDNARNNGIKLNNIDSGIYVHTKMNTDLGKFKTSSLKNIGLRKRYMHDGSIIGLDQVINHYNFNILQNPNLDSHLKNGTGDPIQMNLLPQEINALKAFLETLTDYKLIKDEKYKNPFK